MVIFALKDQLFPNAGEGHGLHVEDRSKEPRASALEFNELAILMTEEEQFACSSSVFVHNLKNSILGVLVKNRDDAPFEFTHSLPRSNWIDDRLGACVYEDHINEPSTECNITNRELLRCFGGSNPQQSDVIMSQIMLNVN